MDWLWQGIITTFVCYVLSKLFSYIKRGFLFYYHYEKKHSTSKTVFNLYWKGYICIFISQLSVCYMLWNWNNDNVNISLFIASTLFCISNAYLFYSLSYAKNKFTYKKTKKITKENSNNIKN